MSWTQSRFLGGLDMSMFSLQCCYAALTAYASEGGGLLDAILQMVIVEIIAIQMYIWTRDLFLPS